MSRKSFFLLFAGMATLASCGTTNSAEMYDPNAPVAAITVSTSGTVDPAARSMAIPPGNDDLLVALRTALSNDGWTVSTSTTNTRYVMQLQTAVWSFNQKLSSIDLTVVDARTGAKILTGSRKMYGPNDKPIDVNEVADSVVSSLRKITSPPPS